MKFLLDANMPRAVAAVVRAAGYDCSHVRDTEFAHAPDCEIAAYARANSLTLITRDFDFADERSYPPREYCGIIVLVVPEFATSAMLVSLVSAMFRQTECMRELRGRLAIVEFGRIRLRPKS